MLKTSEVKSTNYSGVVAVGPDIVLLLEVKKQFNDLLIEYDDVL